jgi:uncharacterized membrane protein YtjA (UPF0391 family)
MFRLNLSKTIDEEVNWPHEFKKFRRPLMLQAAIAFFVLALVAMVLGAGNIAGVSMEIGRTLLWVFLVLAVVSFIASLLTGRSKRLP